MIGQTDHTFIPQGLRPHLSTYSLQETTALRRDKLSVYLSISKPFSFLLQIPNRVTMKCMAVELKGSQWAFYLIMGLLAIFFCIVNVLWFNTTGGSAISPSIHSGSTGKPPSRTCPTVMSARSASRGCHGAHTRSRWTRGRTDLSKKRFRSNGFGWRSSDRSCGCCRPVLQSIGSQKCSGSLTISLGTGEPSYEVNKQKCERRQAPPAPPPLDRIRIRSCRR